MMRAREEILLPLLYDTFWSDIGRLLLAHVIATLSLLELEKRQTVTWPFKSSPAASCSLYSITAFILLFIHHYFISIHDVMRTSNSFVHPRLGKRRSAFSTTGTKPI